MDLVIILLWLLAFSVIVLFLGTLNYFIGRPHSDVNILENKSQPDTTNQQQQSNRSSTGNNRRKHRNANRKQRQQAATAAAATNESMNSDNDSEDKQEIKLISSEIKIEEEESLIESSVQPTDEEHEQVQKEEFTEPVKTEEIVILSSTTSIQDEQKPTLPIKQRNKNKSHHTNSKSSSPTNLSSTLSISSKDESILPSKPQASVAPVKQPFSLVSSTTIEPIQQSQDNNAKSNGTLSSSHNNYSYSERSSLPPRFQQQRQQKEAAAIQKFRKRKPTKKTFIPPDSVIRQNDFVPLVSNQQLESPLEQQQLQHQSSNHNGYSSESDILTESSSTAPPLSIESQLSLKRSDLIRSLSTSNIFLDELTSIFDTTSFSSDELKLLLNKITTKYLLNKQDWQHLSSTTAKTEKTIERILDETCRSQAKILAIELQTEKNRVLELTKVNAEMDTTIRQLQQPNNNMLPYQQTILSYQMQIRRVTDENARLAHQLHVYSIMPASINELKQQQLILNEQLRQLTIRNSNLEQEISDGERASKQAAEIYRKADIQKQDRIEQMLSDINKYKKIDKDFSTLRDKHSELEKNLSLKLNDLTNQRDKLEKSRDQLKDKVQQYDELKLKYDQLSQTQTSNFDRLQQELIEVKAKNDLLRQRNWKIIEQLNKLSHEQKSTQSS